mmetsp:Transcript_86482/g.231039  ORF Transcript_86482/g.231039 Transcript_86482/m.231039 type:complete len:87 (+) Transcript_86482:271-531(+)
MGPQQEDVLSAVKKSRRIFIGVDQPLPYVDQASAAAFQKHQFLKTILPCHPRKTQKRHVQKVPQIHTPRNQEIIASIFDRFLISLP